MLQFTFNLLLFKILVPVERAQALLRGKKSSLPVRVNASPFQHERSHIHAGHILSENILEEDCLGNLIVHIGRELQSPAVEHEIIEIFLTIVPIDRDSAVVTRPGVIDFALREMDSVNVNVQMQGIRQFRQSRGSLLHRCRNYQKFLSLKHGRSYLRITFLNLVQFIPRSSIIRPSQLDSTLFLPFCR